MGTLIPQSNGPLYSNTMIGTLAFDWWAVTFGTARRGLSGLRPRPVPCKSKSKSRSLCSPALTGNSHERAHGVPTYAARNRCVFRRRRNEMTDSCLSWSDAGSEFHAVGADRNGLFLSARQQGWRQSTSLITASQSLPILDVATSVRLHVVAPSCENT